MYNKDEVTTEDSLFIEITDSLNQITTFNLQKNNIIGSSNTCDIVLNDKNISEKHAKIKLNADITMFTLLVTSKTSINKQIIDKGKMYILEENDVIQIASFSLIIKRSKENQKTSNLVIPKAEDIIQELDQQEEDRQTDTQNITKILQFKRSTNDSTIEQEDTKKILENIKQRKEKQKEKLTNLKRHNSLVWVLRFLSYFFNIIVFIFLYDLFIIKHPSFYYFLSHHIDFISNLIDISPYLDYLHYLNYLQMYILFACFQILMTLLFNKNIGHLIALYRVESTKSMSLVQVKIRSVMRAIIAVLTTPLLIFDLPLLLNKRSLKEFLTLTTLNIKSIPQAFIFFISISTIFLTLLISMPLILKYKTFNYDIEAQKIVINNISDKVFTSKKKVEFNHFKILDRTYKQKIPLAIQILPGFFNKKASLYISTFKPKHDFIISPLSTKKFNLRLLFNKNTFMYKTLSLISDYSNINYTIMAIMLSKRNIQNYILKFGVNFLFPLQVKSLFIKKLKLNKVKYLTTNKNIFILNIGKKISHLYIINQSTISSFALNFNKGINYNKLMYLCASFFDNISNTPTPTNSFAIKILNILREQATNNLEHNKIENLNLNSDSLKFTIKNKNKLRKSKLFTIFALKTKANFTQNSNKIIKILSSKY